MFCCLNQYWLFVGEIRWRSPEGNFTKRILNINNYNRLENYLTKISSKLLGTFELMKRWTDKRRCYNTEIRMKSVKYHPTKIFIWKVVPPELELACAGYYVGIRVSDGVSRVMSWHGNAFGIHYDDVIMGVLSSQITSLTTVYSNVYSGADQRKHQSSTSLDFVPGIHWRPANFPHKWSVTRKMFPFDDVIMTVTVVRAAHGQLGTPLKKDQWCETLVLFFN